MVRMAKETVNPASARVTREQMERSEVAVLAPYAQRSGESAGRQFPEPRHPFRTEYQRDRSRIIHSKAFRRLEHKTQVFLDGSGDHLRNRLTHTIEVASISRTIARALGLNEDLAEAIALAHDLGHAPFGHSGEETLDRLMKEHGGFEHNLQSLRVVQVLEQKYPGFQGLNLSAEVLEGLRKHSKFHEAPQTHGGKGEGGHPSPSLEAQIANLADEITYYSHDLDDGLEFELLSPRKLARLEIWGEMEERVRRDFPKLKGESFRRYLVRCLIDYQVEDLIASSAESISRSGVRSVAEVRHHPRALIRYSDRLRVMNLQLRKFLYANLYYHPEVAGANQRACNLLENFFAACIKRPELLGVGARGRIKEQGMHRAVCDYLAGMTDRYLIEEHERVFGHGKDHASRPQRPNRLAKQSRRD